MNNTAVRDSDVGLHKEAVPLIKVNFLFGTKSHCYIIGQVFVSFIRAFYSPKVSLAAPVWVWSVPARSPVVRQSERADGAPISFKQLFLNGWAKEGDRPSLLLHLWDVKFFSLSFSLCPSVSIYVSLSQNNPTASMHTNTHIYTHFCICFFNY